jgi:peptide chain release factor 3
MARWVEGGWPAVEAGGRLVNAATVKDVYERPVLLFRNSWNLEQLEADNKKLGPLLPYALPPKAAAEKKGAGKKK